MEEVWERSDMVDHKLSSVGQAVWAGERKFPKIEEPYENLGARRLTRSKLHTEDQRMLGATVHNLVGRVMRAPMNFAHPPPPILS